MTYLQYKEISLGEDTTADMEHDITRAREERSIAIRSFFAGRGRGLLDLLISILGRDSFRRANAFPKPDSARQ